MGCPWVNFANAIPAQVKPGYMLETPKDFSTKV